MRPVLRVAQSKAVIPLERLPFDDLKISATPGKQNGLLSDFEINAGEMGPIECAGRFQSDACSRDTTLVHALGSCEVKLLF
jgi:hypothetical protein